MAKTPKIIPRKSYVLIKPNVEEVRESEQGLTLPSSVEQEQKAIGVVEAVSKEITDLKVGDTVIYGVYAGETIQQRENGKEVERKLIHDDDVIALYK